MDDFEVRLKLLGEAESAIKALIDTEKASDRYEKSTEKLGKTAKSTGKDIEDLGDKADKSESLLLKGAKGAGGFAKKIGLISAAIGVLGSIAAGFSIASTFDATDELRELQMGVKTLDDLSDGALALNANMSELDISKIIAVNDQWQQQKDHLTELSGMLTGSLSPIMHGVMSEFEQGWKDLGITQEDVTDAIISGMGFVVDVIDHGKMALKVLELSWLGLKKAGIDVFVAWGDKGAEFADVVVGGIVRSFGEAGDELALFIGGLSMDALGAGMTDTGVKLNKLASSISQASREMTDFEITSESLKVTQSELAVEINTAQKELQALAELPSGAERITAWYKEQEAQLGKVAAAQLALRKEKAKAGALAKEDLERAKAVLEALKEKQKAIDDLTKSYENEIVALVDEYKQLTLNERQYYKSTLGLKDLTDQKIAMAMALWDQNEALYAQRDAVETNDEAVANLSATMDDWFNNLFENGVSAFDDLWDSAQSFFRNLAAQMARKWVLQLVGVGSASVSGIAQAGGVGGVGSVSGGLGSVGSLFSGYGIGEGIALTEYNMFGTDLFGGAAGYSNLAYGGVGLLAGLIGDELFGGQGGTGSSLGSMGAMAMGFGPLGIIVGGLLGGALGGLFDSGPRPIAAGFETLPDIDTAYGTADGSSATYNETGKAFWRETDFGLYGLLGTDKGGTTVGLQSDQIEVIMSMFDTMEGLDNILIGMSSDDEIAKIKSDLDGFEGSALSPVELIKERLGIIFETIPNELANIVDLEAPIEDIVYEIEKLGAINTQLLPTMQAMGFEFDEVNTIAIATVYGLAEANGGLEAFANSLQAFYSVSMNFAFDIEALKFRLLEDDEARYDYLKAQSDELVAQLQTATEIDDITLLSEQIRQLTNQGLGLLTEEQIQGGMGQEQLDFFEQIQDLGNDRLQSAIDAQADTVSASAQVQEVAATSLEASANIFGQAADSILTSASIISGAASSFLATSSTPQVLTVNLGSSGSELGLAP